MQLARNCRECGSRFTTDNYEKEFCATPCRLAFNNRRMRRGAALYDLFMVMRFDRPTARRMGLWGAACALASQWREEDRAERAGRTSWQRPHRALDRR